MAESHHHRWKEEKIATSGRFLAVSVLQAKQVRGTVDSHDAWDTERWYLEEGMEPWRPETRSRLAKIVALRTWRKPCLALDERYLDQVATPSDAQR
jgi:hypothetical protein